MFSSGVAHPGLNFQGWAVFKRVNKFPTYWIKIQLGALIVLSLRDTGQQSTTYLFDGHATFQVGDEIVYVNGQSFDRLTHDEAVNVLKSSHHLDFVVRYIGKVPHSSLMPNRSQLAALAPNSNSSVSNNTHNPTTKVQSWNPYQVPLLFTGHGV